jgi:hypothetical protein
LQGGSFETAATSAAAGYNAAVNNDMGLNKSSYITTDQLHKEADSCLNSRSDKVSCINSLKHDYPDLFGESTWKHYFRTAELKEEDDKRRYEFAVTSCQGLSSAACLDKYDSYLKQNFNEHILPILTIRGGGKGARGGNYEPELTVKPTSSTPKPPSNIEPITNAAQSPQIPKGWISTPGRVEGSTIYHPPGTTAGQPGVPDIRVMPAGRSTVPGLEDGYWVQRNQFGQPINPSTGKPGSRGETHIPLP